MRKFTFILIQLLLFSCSNQTPEVTIPSNVLDKEKFSQVITDFTLAESAVSINIKNASAEKYDTIYAFDPLIKNGIDRKTFDTSLYFYCHNPEAFKEVYQLVMEKLSRLQSSRK